MQNVFFLCSCQAEGYFHITSVSLCGQISAVCVFRFVDLQHCLAGRQVSQHAQACMFGLAEPTSSVVWVALEQDQRELV